MAVKACRDCGANVVWVAYEVNDKGEFLRSEDHKAIVHHCERRPDGQRPAQQDQEPTIPFGKYRGEKIATLAQTAEGIDYLKWAVDRVEKPWLKEAITNALQGHYGSAMRPAQEPGSTQDDSWDD